jgi:16S rRNA (cytidine1402-2'-O)-methyltransferase
MKSGKLYLVPTPIATDTMDVLPVNTRQICNRLDLFYAENIRTARRFLSQLQIDQSIEDIRFEEFSKKTPEGAIDSLIRPIFEGKDAGLVSEAGCPGIADPGSGLIRAAHQYGISVVPLVGPSSIYLSLMASGLNGQSFQFHGYVPIDKKQLRSFLKTIEKDALKKNQTQIFMDTPYRNERLFQEIIATLRPEMWLSVSADITGKNEFICTRQVFQWKNKQPGIHKIPALFLVCG